MNGKERRRYPRVDLGGRVGGQATVETAFKVVSINENGASIEMTMPLPIGARCELRLNLEAVLDVKSNVVNVQSPQGHDGSYLLGVQFKPLKAGDRALLEAFLRRERESLE